MDLNTPVYRATLAEAKRRTRKGSPERRLLVEMDERTTPKRGRSSGPHIHLDPVVAYASGGPVPPPSAAALDRVRAFNQELRR